MRSTFDGWRHNVDPQSLKGNAAECRHWDSDHKFMNNQQQKPKFLQGQEVSRVSMFLTPSDSKKRLWFLFNVLAKFQCQGIVSGFLVSILSALERDCHVRMGACWTMSLPLYLHLILLSVCSGVPLLLELLLRLQLSDSANSVACLVSLSLPITQISFSVFLLALVDFK